MFGVTLDSLSVVDRLLESRVGDLLSVADAELENDADRPCPDKDSLIDNWFEEDKRLLVELEENSTVRLPV